MYSDVIIDEIYTERCRIFLRQSSTPVIINTIIATTTITTSTILRSNNLSKQIVCQSSFIVIHKFFMPLIILKLINIILLHLLMTNYF